MRRRIPLASAALLLQAASAFAQNGVAFPVIPVAHPLILRTDGVVVRHTAFHNALIEIPALVVPAVVVRPEHQSSESHEPLLIVIADSRLEKIPVFHNVAKHGCHTKE